MKKTLIVGDVHEPLELICKGPVIADYRCPETENTREDASHEADCNADVRRAHHGSEAKSAPREGFF